MKKRIACGLLAVLGCSLSFGSSLALAGCKDGPLSHDDTVKEGHTDVYKASFKGGERAMVRARAHGDDIDMKIFDSHNNLVEEDTDNDDVPVCVWTPKWTGQFTIKIINNEKNDVDYHLDSN